MIKGTRIRYTKVFIKGIKSMYSEKSWFKNIRKYIGNKMICRINKIGVAINIKLSFP